MTPSRRAKIVCTLGPATFSEMVIEKLIRSGMDVARLNFSHGDNQTYKNVIQILREKSKKIKKQITIIQDLQGPKIRVGNLKADLFVKEGQKIKVTTRDIEGFGDILPIPYAPLRHALEKENRILIDDGLIELEVIQGGGTEILCRVLNPGVIKSHKGVNLPYLKGNAPTMTQKDLKDLAFGIREGVDFIALSFVRSAKDISFLRTKIPKTSGIGIIAKIEKKEALDHFDEILDAADGIMVARGDLAIESSMEMVPCLQKEIIQKCNIALKPVITATQMLESMVEHPRPTRSETSDVANAALDGTDALMFSAETASGAYPIESVKMMDTIIQEVERHHHYHEKEFFFKPHMGYAKSKFAVGDGSMEGAACHLAQGIGASFICCLSEKGRSAVRLSKHRPRQPIIALTHDPKTLNKLSLVWGVRAYLIKNLLKRGKIYNLIQRILLKDLKLGHAGDKIVITTGVFTKSPETTRIIKVHTL